MCKSLASVLGKLYYSFSTLGASLGWPPSLDPLLMFPLFPEDLPQEMHLKPALLGNIFELIRVGLVQGVCFLISVWSIMHF